MFGEKVFSSLPDDKLLNPYFLSVIGVDKIEIMEKLDNYSDCKNQTCGFSQFEDVDYHIYSSGLRITVGIKSKSHVVLTSVCWDPKTRKYFTPSFAVDHRIGIAWTGFSPSTLQLVYEMYTFENCNDSKVDLKQIFQISGKVPCGAQILLAAYDENKTRLLKISSHTNPYLNSSLPSKAVAYLKDNKEMFSESCLTELVKHSLLALKHSLPLDFKFTSDKIVVAVVGDDCVFNPRYDTPIRRFVEMIDSGTEMPPLTDPFMQTWYWRDEDEELIDAWEPRRERRSERTLTVGRFEEVDFHALVFKSSMATVGVKNDKYVVLVAVSEDHRTGRCMKSVLDIDARVGISSAGYEYETRNVGLNLGICTSFKSGPVITIPEIVTAAGDVFYESRILLAGHDESGLHLLKISCEKEIFESESATIYLKEQQKYFAKSSLRDLVRYGIEALKRALPHDIKITSENIDVGTVGVDSDFHIYWGKALELLVQGNYDPTVHLNETTDQFEEKLLFVSGNLKPHVYWGKELEILRPLGRQQFR